MVSEEIELFICLGVDESAGEFFIYFRGDFGMEWMVMVIYDIKGSNSTPSNSLIISLD